MNTLEDLKNKLGCAYKFTAKYDGKQLREILQSNSEAYSDEVPYSLEAGCVSIEITLFHNGDRLYAGYDVCVRTHELPTQWSSYDSLSDAVNPNVKNMEQEMFGILDNFVQENNLSYVDLNPLKETEIESKYPNMEM